MLERNWCVYKHTFPNGNVYIGITGKEPKRRWANGLGYKGQSVFSEIEKYGWENIKHNVILDGLTSFQAEIMEKELIKAYDEKSYNVMCTPAYNKTSVICNKNNSPKRIYWEINGEIKSMDEWCKMFNTSPSTVYGRVNGMGLSLYQALTFPKVPNNKWRLNPIGYWKSLGLLDESFKLSQKT